MKAISFLIGVVLATLGSAQNFTNIRSNTSGTGEFRVKDVVYKLTELFLTLDQPGTFSLTLKSDKRTFNFSGVWSRSSASAARLMIKSGSLQQPRGTADVFLNKDWSVASVNLNGSGIEGSFAGTFRTSKVGGNTPPPIGGVLDQTRSGTGTLRYLDDRNRERLTRARVVLTRRGDFEVTVYGRNESWRYAGTWRYASDADVRLTIADGTGQGRQSGTGTVHSDFRGGFSSIELDGKVNGRSFTLNFRADSSGGDDWELIDTVRGEGLINGPGTEDYTLKKANVSLYRNGTFEIILESHRNHIYEGRWRDAGNQIDLVLTNVRGAGNLVRNGRSVNRFAFSYTEDGKNYIVSFQAGR